MAGGQRAGRVTVVVVDGDPDVRSLLRIFLDAEGFDVVGEAADGEVAIEMVGVLRPDVAVVALELPHVDGLAALPLLRHRSPSTGVVMYAAGVRVPEARVARSLGADAVVAKMGPLTDLRQAVVDAADTGRRVLAR